MIHQETPAMTTARMRKVRRRDTPAELVIRRHLTHLGLRYRVDVEPWPGFRRRADIVFRRERIAIFVDGCFWHGCPLHYVSPKRNGDWWRSKITSNVRKDGEVAASLTTNGWSCLRFWTHSDMDDAAQDIARRVKSVHRTVAVKV